MAAAKKTVPSTKQVFESIAQSAKTSVSSKDYPLPDSVTVLGREVTIEAMPMTWEDDGEFDPNAVHIRVKHGQVAIEEADTVLHETIHAIDYWLDLEMSERQVRVLATALIGVFQDNPEFAEYVTRPMRTNQF